MDAQTMTEQRDKINKRESHERLHAILQGAFAGPPTQLKDIPKRNGESRSQAKNGSHPSELKGGKHKRRKDQKAE
jgi:hypothetical protein